MINMKKWDKMSSDQRSGILWLVGIGLMVILVMVNLVSAEVDAAKFRKMTPAEHLAAAHVEVKLHVQNFSTAIPHLEAIPTSAPEYAEALKGIEWIRAKGLEDAQHLHEEQQRWREEQDIRTARPIAAKNLQDEIRNLGYALDVTVSSKPGELVISSSDFKDSDHRIRFLAFIRGRDNLRWGFQTVRLKSGWLFSEAYPL